MTDHDQSIPGFNARRAALRILDGVLRRGETLDQASRVARQSLGSDHDAADRALALALAAESLRWLTDLDGLIDSQMRLPLASDAKARAVLRLMLAGWLRLETPPHAVIATGLPLLTGGPRRLAHGVFSALVRQNVKLPDAPTLSLPVATRWRDVWGEAPTHSMALALAAPPPLDLTLRDPDTTHSWAQKLEGISLMPGHLRLARGAAVEKLAGYDEGAWWVQDLAASLPAQLLGKPGAVRGMSVLDLCAAPGGKSLQFAAAGWQVTALDNNARRLELLRSNFQRTGLSAEIVQADARQWTPPVRFDAVLIDAPCTATGTCRRHPDVLHRITERHITEMAQFQRELLAGAARWLRPGGRLVYAVCSLEQAEGEAQARAMDSDRWLPDPIGAEELPAQISPTPEGWLRTHPGIMAEEGGLDGFFAARWILR